MLSVRLLFEQVHYVQHASLLLLLSSVWVDSEQGNPLISAWHLTTSWIYTNASCVSVRTPSCLLYRTFTYMQLKMKLSSKNVMSGLKNVQMYSKRHQLKLLSTKSQIHKLLHAAGQA